LYVREGGREREGDRGRESEGEREREREREILVVAEMQKIVDSNILSLFPTSLQLAHLNCEKLQMTFFN
jgi:hypothetical protein